MPQWLQDLFARYGYAVVFLGVFLENVGVPVPGETVLLAGAALSHFGQLSLGWVIVTAIIGATLGDNLGFFIGRRGGRKLAVAYGARFGLTPARLAQFDRFFDGHGPWTVFIARFITGLRVFCAILAGGSTMRWPTFVLFNASGAVVWCVTIACAGYALARSWTVLETWIGRTGLIGLVIGVAAVVVWWLRQRRDATS